jgi:hypothetical protein
MDINRFNAEVRPYLIEIPIGKQGIGFDRVDLDDWFDEYKNRNGRPGKSMEGGNSWDRKSRQGFSNVVTHGTSTKQLLEKEFEKVVEQARSKKQIVT